MSLNNLILSLISGIADPSERTNIAMTIKYLYDVYSSGKVQDKEIEESLYEVCRDVISATNPNLLPEEVDNLAKTKAEEFLKAFRIEGLQRRTLARFRSMPI